MAVMSVRIEPGMLTVIGVPACEWAGLRSNDTKAVTANSAGNLPGTLLGAEPPP